MTQDMTEDRPAAPKGAGSGMKKAALSTALRANLQRRKASERALRSGEAAEQPPAPVSGECDSEGKWTK